MNVDLSSKEQDTLLRIYVGQNIREEGILKSEVPEAPVAEILLSKGLITTKHWYLDQYTTTEAGNIIS